MRSETKARTREALLAAASEVFREVGVDGSSLDAICARAGFTRGALYVHFPSREALVEAVVEGIVGRWTARVVVSADAGGDLERSILGFARDLEGTDELRLVLEAAHRVPAVRARFLGLAEAVKGLLAQQVRAAQAEGRARSDVDPEGTASMLMALALGMVALAEVGVPGEALGVAEVVRKGWNVG